MPRYDFTADRDKRHTPDGDQSFTALNSHTQPSLLTPGTLSRLENCQLEADGMIVTRPGLDWWNLPRLYSAATGTNSDAHVGSLFFYDTPTKEALLVWYEVGSQTTCHLIPMGFDGSWLNVDDNDAPVIWTQPGGATADPALPGVSLSQQMWKEQTLYGEIPPHTQWAQLVDRAYLAGNFVCDGVATNAATRDGAAGSVGLTSGEYFLWSFWWNGTAWERRPVQTPARFQHLTTLRYRLYAAPGRGSSERETIYCSDILNGTVWGVVNSAVVGEGNGDPIMGLASYDDRLLAVIKERSVWLVDVSGSAYAGTAAVSPTISAAAWSMQKVASGGGCVAPRTVIAADGDVYWLSRQGLMGLARVRENGRTEAATDLGLPIREILARVNWAVVEHTASATFHEGKVYLALPVDGAAIANLIVVFHVARQAWEGVWSFAPGIDTAYYATAGGQSVQARALAVSWFGGVEKLHLAGWNVCSFEPALTSDLPDSVPGAAPIAASATTRAFTHGYPLDDKRGQNLEVAFSDSECNAVKIEAIRDGLPAQTVAENVRTHTQPVTPIQTPFVTVAQSTLRRRYYLGAIGPYRDLQIRVTQTGTGRLRLRSLIATATTRHPKPLS